MAAVSMGKDWARRRGSCVRGVRMELGGWLLPARLPGSIALRMR